MTDTPQPTITEQIAAVREPGWYWVQHKTEHDGEWYPDFWHGWEWETENQLSRPKGTPTLIGPRIPDLATLHRVERMGAVVEAARHFSRDADLQVVHNADCDVAKGHCICGITALAKALAALDAAAPETDQV